MGYYFTILCLLLPLSINFNVYLVHIGNEGDGWVCDGRGPDEDQDGEGDHYNGNALFREILLCIFARTLIWKLNQFYTLHICCL